MFAGFTGHRRSELYSVGYREIVRWREGSIPGMRIPSFVASYCGGSPPPG
jgi:hypothetical protein